jgi:histidinol-phosphatase (PHP family)
MPDYHVHTFRCGHAGGDSRAFVEAAIARGLAEIAFTDHIPLYFLPPERRDPKLAMREDEFDGYIEEVRSLAREFEGASRSVSASRPTTPKGSRKS